jgi:serine/threonine protein kinase
LGCAKNILSSIANSLKGTIKYMSPEMISAKPYDFKTDIWSTGVIIYELITLEYPFKGNSLYELVQSILMDVIPNMNTSKLLKNLVKM